MVIYEGTPDTPDRGRFWDIVQKYKVTILYTAPTAIRTMMKWGDDIPAKYDLSSLRVIGSVGEPINPEAWIWYRHVIGGDRTPVVDTWWQTETGAIMISPLPGVTSTKPGSATRPLPGIGADVVDNDGTPVPNGGGGLLVLTEPWPSMLRGIWGDDKRYRETYWGRFDEQGYYFAGDGAKKDDDGDLWLLGRVDDVMLISGHNISTTEVESALVSHPKVAEAAVVGATDPTTGQAIVAFVILRGNAEDGEGLVDELRNHVGQGDRPDRQAAADHDRPGTAQDPQRQDHAAAAQGRRREPPDRRRHHPGRLHRHGPDQGEAAHAPPRTDRRPADRPAGPPLRQLGGWPADRRGGRRARDTRRARDRAEARHFRAIDRGARQGRREAPVDGHPRRDRAGQVGAEDAACAFGGVGIGVVRRCRDHRRLLA